MNKARILAKAMAAQPFRFPMIGRVLGCLSKATIFCYHRVLPVDDPYSFPGITTSLTDFENQVEYLAKFRKVLSLEELITGGFPSGSVAVTFDDGYADVLEYAFPVLERYHVPFIIFIAPMMIDLNSTTTQGNLTTDETFLRQETNNLDSLGEADKFTAVRGSNCMEPTHKVKCPDSSSDSLPVEHPSTSLKRGKLLDWSDLDAMMRTGLASIGSHSLTHVNMATISDVALREEVRVSKKIIERRLRCSVRCFAYPYGRSSDFTPTVKEAVKQVGYLCAVTTIPSSIGAGCHLFSLPRHVVTHQDLNCFVLLANGIHSPLG